MEMKKMRRTIFGALALMLAASDPAAAQGMPPMHDMMMQPNAHMALMHRQELGLTADQVQRLAALDSSWTQAMRAHCAQVHAAGGPNAQTHATMHPQMEAAMQAARAQLATVLTADQLARLDSLHAAHHDQMMHDMAGMQHDSAMAAMHTAMAGGSAPSCGTSSCGGDATCHDCCAHMGCCDAPAAATKP
jgi:hypothetical protein